jgi:glucose/arabinose dehydrogenase
MRFVAVFLLLISTNSFAAIGVQRVFQNIRLTEPLAMVQAPGEPQRWYVAEQGGLIKTFLNDPNTSSLQTFLDLRSLIVPHGPGVGDESGLVGLAFHPKFTQSGWLFVFYTRRAADGTPRAVLVRYTRRLGATVADPASAVTLMSIPLPTFDHHAGTLMFDKTGYLFISVGDGGPQGDPFNNGQRLDELTGSILRIDINKPDLVRRLPYAIPLGNPFAAGGGRPEIWAYGFRNPWKFSFDAFLRTLWVGDVGYNSREEIDRVDSGKNYGWARMEGSLCRVPPCASTLVLPITEYDHSFGCSVTGGYVYRGAQIPELFGTYIYGDFCRGTVFGINGLNRTGVVRGTALLSTPARISSFAEDNLMELYLLDYGAGAIYKIVRR